MFRQIRCVWLLLLCASGAFSQDPSTQTYNTWTGVFVHPSQHPAFAGESLSQRIRLDFDAPFRGIPGAPLVSASTFTGYISAIRSGFGGTFSWGQAGQQENLGVQVHYNYKIRLGEDHRLGVGINAAMWQNNYKEPENGYYYEGWGIWDQLIVPGPSTAFLPDLDLGVWYKFKSFFLGATVQHLLEPAVGRGWSAAEQGKIPRIFTFTPGGTLDFGDLNLLTTATISFSKASWRYEASALATYKNRYALGAGLTRSEVMLHAGFAFKPFRINYAYGLIHNAISRFSSGSHQIGILFDFNALNP